jgi:hypothetical protein
MGDLRVQEGDLNGANQGDHASQQRFGVTCVVWQQRGQTAAYKRQKQ